MLPTPPRGTGACLTVVIIGVFPIRILLPQVLLYSSFRQSTAPAGLPR